LEIAVEKIFIAGSISIKKLDESVTKRIDKMISQGYEIILGDADGIDKAVQNYLNIQGYNKVTIYHSGTSKK
jgi:predicted Rossmann fold nucleotide-binding protein DprA/Smf involved in DNA uptake